MQTATFRERLPSAVAAIALQAGLLAILLLSFQVVRHITEEKEHFITLSPLAQPAPQLRKAAPSPRRTPDAMTPPPVTTPSQLPAWANPGFSLGGVGGSGGNGIRLAQPPTSYACRPENYANLNASDRKACMPQDMARRDPTAIPLNPNPPVKDAPLWQAEIDRRNAPSSVPGASGGIVGILATLLFNPGAYGDKKNYSYAPPDSAAKIDGAEATHQAWSQIPQCNGQLDDTTRKNCAFNRKAAHAIPMGGTADGPSNHVSDAEFAKALAAAQARQQSLSGRPVLASGPQAGDGNEKNSTSGGTGIDPGNAVTRTGR